MANRLRALAAPAAMIGGLLWILYAILRYVRPLPAPAPELAGAGALVLLALALLAASAQLRLPGDGSGRFGLAMAAVTPLAAVAAVVGALAQQEPLAANALVAGELLLAFGVMLVAIEAAGEPASGPAGSILFVVGVAGMVGLFAQALAAAATWMLPIYAALAMAVYGLAWVRFGGWLARER